ncbi:phosphatase PAP2 family protein [Chitinophaga agrisoli]|uniref:Phosphatase PAP2 family protein n=1 Tax=Chitinophaga agrisoli TaxID=2607653 RepID=A0A5B2W383_9BACT|nr:phosphatase PAP2 family protein [Chitinophaga agrisoli]KAA2245112.1 phosphatase PAP2 family protein [Chitinophaga agrisoli]
MERETALHVSDTKPEWPVFPTALRGVAQVVSYLMHPLFIPTIVTFLIVQALPEYFVTFKQYSMRFPYDRLYFRVISISLFFPLLTVLLSRALNFVDSFYLRTQRDRIIPYIATIIYYFWAFYTFIREGVAPPFFNAFFLGIFIAVIASFICNIFVKISMHTMGWGGVIGLLLALMWGMHMNVTIPLVITLFIAGLVGTARMVLAAHSPAEIYAGFIVGILSQLAAYAFVG